MSSSPARGGVGLIGQLEAIDARELTVRCAIASQTLTGLTHDGRPDPDYDLHSDEEAAILGLQRVAIDALVTGAERVTAQ